MTQTNKSPSINPQDRGLLYGDGLFTTLAALPQRPLCWEQHWQRLRDGCQRLNIPAPAQADLECRLYSLCDALSQPAVIKILITRGVGGRGYNPPAAAQPNLLVSQHPGLNYPAHFWQQGVKVRLCRTRLAIQPRLAGIKHLNRLENVLARSEWDNAEIAEGLMLDMHEHLVEGTMSNLFFVQHGCLCTPSLQECGVAGVMRGLILQAAQQLAIPTRISHFSLAALYAAAEVFLSNSLIGLWSVHSLQEDTSRLHQWSSQALATRLRIHLAPHLVTWNHS